MALINDLKAEFEPATTTEANPRRKNGASPMAHPASPQPPGRSFRLISTESGVPKNLGLLIRYHNSAERAFHRAHNELVKTQKERKKSEIGFDPQKASQPPKPADPEPPQPPLDYQIVPDFTYQTPKAAARAATFPQAA